MSTHNKKPRWRYWLRELFFAIVIIGVASYGMDFYHSNDAPKGKAPEIQAFDINGELVDVNALSQDGQPVIVYFWATWCGACKWVSPTVDWFAEDHHVVTVALSSGDDARIQSYLTAKQHQFPVINDQQGHISREWGISVTPTIAIIKNGDIKYLTAGVTTPWGLWLRTIFA
ncbi:protein disulfide oxidoreductase [Vibrio renipiscarius]|uniref:Membrane protein n=1 Tax=Vibrio renipiscarius TaxID=1461322 RepID=A0A0C2NC73_9VIBR|nr:protein disulfide oxidoreductase [Vibrio renipiscarius]KII77076.1 membrane protein [Vibrio renipiscarius]KII77206.1 membrane protein [Vibrio renipiscarius]